MPSCGTTSLLQALRELSIKPNDVIFFCHDSASYMAPAAECLQKVFGYSNLVHGPCWAHLLNILGNLVFDQKLLKTTDKYLWLTRYKSHLCWLYFLFCDRLVFSRSPYWRTKWIEHQREKYDEQNARGTRCARHLYLMACKPI